MLAFFVPLWAGVSEEEWNVCRGDEEGLAGLPSMPRNKTDFGDLQKLKTLRFIFLRDHGECRVGVTGNFFCACHLWWKGDAPDHDERTYPFFFSFLEKLLSVRDSPPLFRSARTSCSTLG